MCAPFAINGLRACAEVAIPQLTHCTRCLRRRDILEWASAAPAQHFYSYMACESEGTLFCSISPFYQRHKAFLCDKCNAERPFMNITRSLSRRARAMNFPSLNCRHKSATIKRIDLHSNYFGNRLHLVWKSAARKRREESGICQSNLWLLLIERTEHALQQNRSRRVIGDVALRVSRCLLGPLVNRFQI